MTKQTQTISTVAAIIAALLFLQSLFFKFTAAPESVALFSQLGLEPYGRWGIGIAELIASIMLLFPKTRPSGGVLGVMIILGAIASHLLFLGINYKGDGGLLFGMAVVIFICCTVVVKLNQAELQSFVDKTKSLD